MNATTSIRVDMQDSLAVVSLAQPARGNPIDGDFARDFKQVFSDLHDQGGLRAVLLRGDGANFSFGGDLKSLYAQRSALGSIVRRWTADLHMGLQRAWKLPAPVVVAVQGFAMGGAAALVAGCDLVLAAESARIGSAFAKIGFSCDSGSSVTLTARMGAARARRFVLLGEVLGAQEAMQAGLVDRIVADDKLQDEALALARELAQGPTLAYGEIKRLFLRSAGASPEAQLEDEAMTLARIASSLDAQEGIAAMVERRKPVFRGQ